MSDTARHVVSLDSSSSGSLSLEDVLAADAALGHMPFVSFASIYEGQLRMKRELDSMFLRVDDMQVKLDTLSSEVAAIKKRRL